MVYYPVIIFDGKMFEYFLDEKEEPKLTEAKYVKYDVAFPSQSEGVERNQETPQSFTMV